MIRRISLSTSLLLAMGSVAAFPGQYLFFAQPEAPKPRTRQEIFRDAITRMGSRAQEHTTTTRTGLKTTQNLVLARLKEQLEAQKLVIDEGWSEEERLIIGPLTLTQRIRGWMALHADLIVDLVKIVSSHLINTTIPAGSTLREGDLLHEGDLQRTDRMIEAYVPALTKTIDKNGLASTKTTKTIIGTTLASNCFADKDSTLDVATGHLNTALTFFDDDVLLAPHTFRRYFNFTKGTQALTMHGVKLLTGMLIDKKLGEKLEKNTRKLLTALVTRLLMEPTRHVVKRAIEAAYSKATTPASVPTATIPREGSSPTV